MGVGSSTCLLRNYRKVRHDFPGTDTDTMIMASPFYLVAYLFLSGVRGSLPIFMATCMGNLPLPIHTEMVYLKVSINMEFLNFSLVYQWKLH